MSSGENPPKKIFRKPAANDKACEKMADKYGWDLLDVEPTNVPLLEVDCIFYGQEINFQEIWYDYQD